ncbi:hypothetical protein GWD52_19485 [Enterobacteriaceae bacterium 4M9]|nr:hypothetical protein [Enterobacteriaceae bacterium 4M9]
MYHSTAIAGMQATANVLSKNNEKNEDHGMKPGSGAQNQKIVPANGYRATLSREKDTLHKEHKMQKNVTFSR